MGFPGNVSGKSSASIGDYIKMKDDIDFHAAMQITVTGLDNLADGARRVGREDVAQRAEAASKFLVDFLSAANAAAQERIKELESLLKGST